MSDSEKLKDAVQRTKKLLSIKPSKGQYTTTTNVRLTDGTTCVVSHGPWTFKADIGKSEGGNDAGPGPGILERAALGSCLTIGYAKYVALLEVPVKSLEVEVIADVDARGAYGVDGVSPGYQGLRYRVNIESPASEEKIREVIETADTNSPVLSDFREPIDLQREIIINSESTDNTKARELS